MYWYVGRGYVCQYFQYDAKSVITVEQNGAGDASPMDEIQNNFIYKGSENELILSRVYTTNFLCEFGLSRYPFDTQKCSMIFIMQVCDIKNCPL